MKYEPTSRAKLFFESLFSTRSSAFNRLSDLVTQNAEENEWREFKGAKFIDDPLPLEASGNGKKRGEIEKQRKEDVKRLWSESLSAFANNGGGVLIWGIDAPNRVAEKLSLAGDARALEQRLTELQNDAVNPPVLGIEIRAVTKRRNKMGFVVCYIPESAFRPHGAQWAKREYYMRMSDSNRVISTPLLRQMFYPQFAPRLVPIVSAKLVKREVNGDGSSFHKADGLFHIEIIVVITNRSNASAQDACIMFWRELHCAAKESLPNSLWEIAHHHASDWRNCKMTIHPEQTIPFLDNLTNFDGFESPEDANEFVMGFKIFAHNAPALIWECSFTGAELKKSFTDGAPIRRDAAPSQLHNQI